MGGLRKYMPITWITSLLGSLALIGTPLFSGFYSKDSIIEAVHASHICRARASPTSRCWPACSSRPSIRSACTSWCSTARSASTRTRTRIDHDATTSPIRTTTTDEHAQAARVALGGDRCR